MDDAQLAARHHASHAAALAEVARRSPRGEVVRLGGVHACVMPERPGRSLFNSVLYEDAGDLAARIGELAAMYDRAGVHAWTVYVAPADAPVLRPVLEADGHVLDGQPELMCAPLAEVALDVAVPGGVEVGPADAAACAAMTDVAWGLEAGEWGVPLARLDEPYRWTAATRDGEILCCVATCEHEGDAYVTFVSTLAEHRGRGLAAATMACALRGSAERGCTTTSLEATAMGRPVYARLGLRELGPVEMWERRRPPV